MSTGNKVGKRPQAVASNGVAPFSERRSWRGRRCLRRIADLEAALAIWPPWHFVRTAWYDMHGGAGFEYRTPRDGDKGHA